MNHAAAKSTIIRLMGRLDPSGYHAKMYTELFEKMDDARFTRFMNGLVSGENPLTAYEPNFNEEIQITTDNNVALASELGKELYQHIWITDPVTGDVNLTPRKHLVYETNICRQTQTLDHKISTAEDSSSINEMTGQVTGRSKASQCSGPEFMILNSQGLDQPIKELIKFRGGDLVSNRILTNQIIKEGGATMAGVPGAADRSAKSVQTLSIILNGMLFSNNFQGG